jgi:hypothetical protein
MEINIYVIWGPGIAYLVHLLGHVLHDPGFASLRRHWDFCRVQNVGPALKPTPPHTEWVLGFFPGGRVVGV